MTGQKPLGGCGGGCPVSVSVCVPCVARVKHKGTGVLQKEGKWATEVWAPSWRGENGCYILLL